jgi:hypothetical protein
MLRKDRVRHLPRHPVAILKESFEVRRLAERETVVHHHHRPIMHRLKERSDVFDG